MCAFQWKDDMGMYYRSNPRQHHYSCCKCNSYFMKAPSRSLTECIAFFVCAATPACAIQNNTPLQTVFLKVNSTASMHL
eukprot:3049426-Amphidinium_carterae.2